MPEGEEFVEVVVVFTGEDFDAFVSENAEDGLPFFHEGSIVSSSDVFGEGIDRDSAAERFVFIFERVAGIIEYGHVVSCGFWLACRLPLYSIGIIGVLPHCGIFVCPRSLLG